MAEIIIFNDDDSFTLQSSAFEISVLIPKYLENLDALEQEEELGLFLSYLKNSYLYRKHLKRVFDMACRFHAEFSFENSMLQSLQVELELLQQAYGQLEDKQRFAPATVFEICSGKEKMLEQMLHIFCLLGINPQSTDLQAVMAAKESLKKEQLQLQLGPLSL